MKTVKIFRNRNSGKARKYIFLILLQAIIISNCCVIPKNKVTGRFHSFNINTTVDSKIAKYYLENYLADNKNDPDSDKKINDINAEYNKETLNRDDLLAISKKTSVDFGAIFFAEKLLKYKNNENLQKEFLKNLEMVKKNEVQFPDKDYLVLIVPGFDYVENGSVTGADFAKPRELISKAGFVTHFVDIDPIGSVEENADYLTKTIRNFPDKNILIAGASSAGPAIYLSLGKYLKKEETKRIKAWLNLGGILQGVPVLDQFSKGYKSLLLDFVIWIKDWKKKSFESMQTEISRKRFSETKLPDNILVINYIGMSLSGNISKFASDKYCLMLDDGPNDGLSLLPDLIVPNTQTILAPESDHFFAEDPEIDMKTVAFLKTILERLEK